MSMNGHAGLLFCLRISKPVLFGLVSYGPRHEKPYVFGGLRTTKGQSSAFVSSLLESIISRNAMREISIFYLVFVAEQIGLNLTLSETLTTDFLALLPNYDLSCNIGEEQPA